MKTRGRFSVECLNPDGSVAWAESVPNMTTNAGINHTIATELAAGAQVTTWYMGLIDNVSYSAVSANDTMSSHAGWVEKTTYNESTRPAWTPGAVSGQQVASSAPTVFTVTTDMTIIGLFIASDNTKGGTVGTLFATALLPLARFIPSGQLVRLNYTFSGTGT